jgi:large subunit ribosomal protein L29
MSTVRDYDEDELVEKIQEMRSELRKLQVDGSKGTLRKESGKLKPLKRDIARMMTRLNELKKKRDKKEK